MDTYYGSIGRSPRRNLIATRSEGPFLARLRDKHTRRRSEKFPAPFSRWDRPGLFEHKPLDIARRDTHSALWLRTIARQKRCRDVVAVLPASLRKRDSALALAAR
jgi:hypothetical protein